GDTLTIRGRPILFGVTVPLGAAHAALGERFVAYLLSEEGRRILRRARFDALDQPVVVGRDPPAALAAGVRDVGAPKR
ncbi:MAG TPA: hypothetical protein VFN38_14550, partial [Gemmatimonadaceae bacterium]|nr:hypothetical protein [Gemmatimonadaceae bacterium]